jgi:DNA-binding response OmpR family regulator
MPKVLIIEDRRENIVFIANNIIKPLGYDVVTAMDGRTGLTKAEEEKPDLIITDLKLPRMGGLEVLDELGQKGLDIPTIVMTFHGTEDTAMRALRLGARDYLIKPFTIEEMQAAIDRALESPAKPSGKSKANDYERLEQELSQTREALIEREDQLKRLSTASQMAARVPQLQQELARLQAALSKQGDQPGQPLPDGEADTKIVKLEQELAQTRNLLAKRENQLRQVQRYLTNFVKKSELAEVTGQATALKEDNARLMETLAQTQRQLSQSQSRVDILEDVISTQKSQLSKYQQQAQKLAEDLRNLSEGVRLLAQDLSQQSNQLENVVPNEKKH